MGRFLKRSGIVIGISGLLLGIALMLGAEQLDRLTTTDAFCSSTCHSMQAYIAAEQTYKTSVHRTTSSGVQAGCADCHVPRGPSHLVAHY